MALERVRELPVAVIGGRRLLGRIPDVRLVDERHRDYLAHQAREPFAVCRDEDRLVEGCVLRDEPAEVRAADELLEAGATLLKPLQRVGVDSRRGPPGSVALEQRPEFVHVRQVGQLVLADRSPTVGRGLDEALCLQHEERLPDRRATDAKRWASSSSFKRWPGLRRPPTIACLIRSAAPALAFRPSGGCPSKMPMTGLNSRAQGRTAPQFVHLAYKISCANESRRVGRR